LDATFSLFDIFIRTNCWIKTFSIYQNKYLK
jgi:hypothetical protein